MVVIPTQNQNRDEDHGKSTSLILDYPNPRTLPAPPSFHEPILLVTLFELEPGKYVSTQAKMIYLKTVEKHDALGEKIVQWFNRRLDI
jgi:hypothetical protein